MCKGYNKSRNYFINKYLNEILRSENITLIKVELSLLVFYSLLNYKTLVLINLYKMIAKKVLLICNKNVTIFYIKYLATKIII